MGPFMVMGTTKSGYLRIFSVHATFDLALESALKTMQRAPSLHRPPDPWEVNPLQLLDQGFPGKLIRAWKNNRFGKDDRDLSSLKIVELEVEGNILDQLSSI